jgi:hypothetical protein
MYTTSFTSHPAEKVTRVKKSESPDALSGSSKGDALQRGPPGLPVGGSVQKGRRTGTTHCYRPSIPKLCLIVLRCFWIGVGGSV